MMFFCIQHECVLCAMCLALHKILLTSSTTGQTLPERPNQLAGSKCLRRYYFRGTCLCKPGAFCLQKTQAFGPDRMSPRQHKPRPRRWLLQTLSTHLQKTRGRPGWCCRHFCFVRPRSRRIHRNGHSFPPFHAESPWCSEDPKAQQAKGGQSSPHPTPSSCRKERWWYPPAASAIWPWDPERATAQCSHLPPFCVKTQTTKQREVVSTSRLGQYQELKQLFFFFFPKKTP